MTEPFKINFQWRPVESTKGIGYLFPDRFTDYALEWLDFPPFEIECVRFESQELWDPFKRKCIENLALTIFQQQCEILNAYADPISKTLRKFLGINISGKRFKEAVEHIRLAQAPIVTQKEAQKLFVRAKL